MNVASIQISVRDGVQAALIYSFGSMVVEIFYVRIIVEAMGWVYKRTRVFRILGWITIFILLSMAIGSFTAAIQMSGLGNALPPFSRNHFFYGVLLSALNPLHFVFWFGWSTVLLNKGVLVAERSYYNLYVAGIGTGTICGFLVFIFGGNYIVTALEDKQYLLNWIIGVVLVVTAVIQIWKTLKVSALVNSKDL